MKFRSVLRIVAVVAMIVFVALVPRTSRSGAATVTPDPVVSDSLAAKGGQQTAVFAGGCFWGLQLVFEHVKGVADVKAGYAGGSAKSANYEIVGSGTTGHAESVKIVYDPSKVTYGQLLKVFFSVAHDPTELNRQGPDEGTQYRSVIFYGNPDQQRIAKAYIAQMETARVFPEKIVTQVVPLQGFYQAEAYHQDYAVHNLHNPYIMINDLPKIENLRNSLPVLYVKNR